jgi:small subunit ribosomal protein S1
MVSKEKAWEEEEGFFPGRNEGWWTAVLIDEDISIATAKENQVKQSSHIGLTSINWEKAQKIFAQDGIVKMYINGQNRGGLLVEGQEIQGFLPVSHLVDAPPENDGKNERKKFLTQYIGRTMDLKIIECEPRSERIVFSERAALAGEGQRKLLFETAHVGEVVTGIVTNVTDFGVFIDLGGVEGLIHVSELSWGRVQHPSDVLKIGQRIKTQILQISKENSRIALSLKRLGPNPWDSLSHFYKEGDEVRGVVTDILRYGAFAKLAEGVEGLIHITSINLQPGYRDISKVLSIGQSVRVKILHVDIPRRRLGLGLVSTE